MSQIRARVMIALPNTGTVKIQTHGSIIAMVEATKQFMPKVGIMEKERREALIDSSRCHLVQDAQILDATHIFFLDSDMIYPVMLLTTMLRASRDIVGASPTNRDISGIMPVAIGMDGKRYMPPVKDTVSEVLSLAGSPLLINLNVFNTIPYPWFLNWDPKAEEFIGEDRYFFRRAREWGYKLWCCDGISHYIGHIGEQAFYLSDVEAE